MSAPRQIHWTPILLEAAFVVLGVFLALISNEWWSAVKREREAEEVLQAVRLELVNNHDLVSSSVQFHGSLSGMIQQALTSGRTLETRDFNQGFMSQSDPQSSAWETAQSSGAIPDMPVEAVLSLSQTYQVQQRYSDQRGEVARMIYQSMFEEGMDGLPQRPMSHLALLGSFMYTECRLLVDYEKAVTAVDGVPADSAMAMPMACSYMPKRSSD